MPSTPALRLSRVTFSALNSRQQENYNFAQVSAILADYGFFTMRLTDDWQGADFIASHIDGNQFLKVQLKSRLCVDTKYKGKDVWICFPNKRKKVWYLFPHDGFLKWALANLNIGNTKGWTCIDDFAKVRGVYTWPRPSQKVVQWLTPYVL